MNVGATLDQILLALTKMTLRFYIRNCPVFVACIEQQQFEKKQYTWVLSHIEFYFTCKNYHRARY